MTQKFSLHNGTGRHQKIRILSVIAALALVAFGIHHWNKPPTLERSKSTASASYFETYRGEITLKDGSKAYLVPVTNSQDHFKYLRTIHKDPSCAANMTDGKPWPDKATKGNQTFYAFSWQLFHDLQRSGQTSTKAITLAFLIFDEAGHLLGDVGIQREKDRLDELFFNTLPAARRKGVAYAAGKYCIALYEKYMGKNPLGANILPANKPSQMLMRKLGFKPLFDAKGKRAVTYTHGRLYELWKRPVQGGN